jgi:phage terminase small subunit
MRGRKAKPLQVQQNEGDPRKKGKGKLAQQISTQANALRGLPECPEYLTGYAREAWNRWKENLEGMGIDRASDALTLETACIAYEAVRVQHAAKQWDKLDKHLKTIRSFQSEFGLTPISYQRITLEAPDSDEADLMAMLSRPRAPRARPVQ